MTIDFVQLQEIIDRITEISPELWQYAISNTIFWGYVDVWAGAILGVFALVIIAVQHWPPRSVFEDFIPLGYVIGSPLFAIALCLIVNGIWRIHNPEFSAIQDILRMMPGGQ